MAEATRQGWREGTAWERANAMARDEAITTPVIAVAFFLLTFAAYWYLGPQETAYMHQVNQANNILNGHLDMVAEHTRNFNTLERVLYDGEGFCFPPGDPKAVEVTGARFSEDCKTYMQHSLGPALIVLPGVAIWGNELNQTLVSVIFGAMTAPIVFLTARSLTRSLGAQIGLTVLMMFGTIFWWIAANGGVWMFAHTTATFFLFAGIYFTLARPMPWMAGLCLAAAFFCRPTVAFTGLFFIIALAPLWLRQAQTAATSDVAKSWVREAKAWIARIDYKPLAQFAIGALPLIALWGLLNYLRFDTPTESGYKYTEQLYQDGLAHVYPHGLFDLSYVKRHPQVMLEQMPIFQDSGPYILPTWFGMAIWMTTPAFALAFFPTIKQQARLWIPAALALAAGCGVMLTQALARAGDGEWGTTEIPYNLHLFPFWLLIAVAITAAIRRWDRIVIACWAAIIPTAFFIFTFAATGWAQFGYRYGLDFTPFLWVLVAKAIGDNFRWYHGLLIALGVAMNIMGVLWIYEFEPNQTNGWTWVVF